MQLYNSQLSKVITSLRSFLLSLICSMGTWSLLLFQETLRLLLVLAQRLRGPNRCNSEKLDGTTFRDII